MKFTIDVLKFVLTEYRLKKDGTFKKVQGIDPKIILEDDYLFDDYFQAKNWTKENPHIELDGKIIDLSPDRAIGFTDYYYQIRPHRIRKPKQNYVTKEQLKNVLKNGDDSKHNSLVIDFDGFLHLLPFEQAVKFPYAVRFETFQAGNGYVGENSNLYHLENTYLALLQGWADHLGSHNQIYRDYTDTRSEDEVIEEIMKYIEEF